MYKKESNNTGGGRCTICHKIGDERDGRLSRGRERREMGGRDNRDSPNAASASRIFVDIE